jgi:DNA invertase Pin-like site-specific DNA recombinase
MTMLPLSGYIRVSRVGDRDKDPESFISPDVQEKAILEWSARTGKAVVMERPELNRSGGTMDRPIFNEILEKIRRGESGGIVVFKLDRFARSLIGAVNCLAELGEHHATFASATEPELDYTTPAGEAFLNMQFTFAQYVRATLKESWATTQRHKIEQGIHISPNKNSGGYLGYSSDDDGRLVLNDQAGIALEVFERAGGGEAWGSIAEWLNEVAPRPNGLRWTSRTVVDLVGKRIYRGEASRYVDQDIDGRGAIVNPDAHSAIVTEEQWTAANAKRQRRQGGYSKHPRPLLAGLVRCAGCRYSLSKGSGGAGQAMYKCRANHSAGKCPAPASIVSDKLEQHVEDLVFAHIDGVTRSIPDDSERTAALEVLAAARTRLDDFKNDREAKLKLGAEWHEWLDGYLADVREAEAALAQIDAQHDAVTHRVTRDHYNDLTVDEKREVLSGFIDVTFVRRSPGRGNRALPVADRARVLWRGEGPDDLPRTRIVNSIVSFDFDDEVAAGAAAA